MIAAGDVVPLSIEKPAAGGRMIARADRLVVLVAGAIPGERVRARIDRVGKGVAYATVVDIDDGSPDRRRAEADPLCGGCLYAHIAYARQREIKALVIADAFTRLARLDLPHPVIVAASPEHGYRMRARLHVRGGVAGFFREGTHDVCDAAATGQLLPETTQAVDRMVAALGRSGLDRVAGLVIAENVDATERAVHLDVAPGAPPLDARSIDRVAAVDGVTGVASASATRGNAHVTDTLVLEGGATVALRRHVLAFFQGNRYLLTDLASHVIGLIPTGASAIDLYAGVGLFSVTAAAARGARVTAVEGDPVAAADLAVNAATTNGAVAAVHRSVEEFVVRRDARKPDPATVIVDPPRTGMSRAALDGICGLQAPRIVYVSCDVATLARDARRIVDSGYTLAGIAAFDLFPNTPHVETVAVFERG